MKRIPWRIVLRLFLTMYFLVYAAVQLLAWRNGEDVHGISGEPLVKLACLDLFLAFIEFARLSTPELDKDEDGDEDVQGPAG